MLSKYLRTVGGGGIAFWCQGCKESHVVWIRGQVPVDGRPSWSWNGDAEKPVFSPSMLVTSGHYMSRWKEGDSCWCTFNKKQREKGEPETTYGCTRCHTFIGCNGAEPGQIIFLQDSTHAESGKVLPLAEFPQHLVDALDKD